MVYALLEKVSILGCFYFPASFGLIYKDCAECAQGQYSCDVINVRNMRGPNIDPWGTPDVTGSQSDMHPSTATHCMQ